MKMLTKLKKIDDAEYIKRHCKGMEAFRKGQQGFYNQQSIRTLSDSYVPVRYFSSMYGYCAAGRSLSYGSVLERKEAPSVGSISSYRQELYHAECNYDSDTVKDISTCNVIETYMRKHPKGLRPIRFKR